MCWRCSRVCVESDLRPTPPQAYLAGLTFALAASPCSTPVLATLLAYVATTHDPFAGAGLLLCYTTGYVAPLLAAAAFTVGPRSATCHGSCVIGQV